MSTINSTSNYNALCEDVIKHTINDGINYTREDLVSLFENTDYFNGGAAGKAAIERQIDNLQKRIKALKEEAATLQGQIDKKNMSAEKKSDDLATIAGKINLETQEYQKDIKEAAKLATRDAMTAYKFSNSESYEACFESAFKGRLGDISGISMAKIKSLYEQYDSVKSTLTPVMSEIQTYLNQVKLLQTKLDNTNASINLLTMTKDKMSDAIKGAYTNCDTDINAPIFTGEKAAVANRLLAKYTIKADGAVPTAENAAPAATNNTATENNTAATQGATETQAATTGTAATATKTTAQIMQGYKDNNKEKYPAGGSYYATYRQNPEVRNLCEAVKGGMLEELQASGASVDEIMKFVSETWNVGIQRNVDANGKVTYVIPNKSDSGKEMYDKLNAFASTGSAVVGKPGKTPTEEKIPTNQFENLKQNGGKVLDEMFNAGFTFKEAMFVFTQIFSGAGIVYDLNTQTLGRNYGILVDDETSGTVYKDIAAKIKGHWNVDSGLAAGSTGIQTQRGNNDPILFQDGDTTYTFFKDKNGNGQFDYDENELLGAERGLEELLEYDYDGNGIIDENDSRTVDGKTVYALDEIMLISNKQHESVGSAEDVNKYKDGSTGYNNTVDFDYGYTNARQAGITSIDLRAAKASGKINGEDNVDEDYNDVNGSNVINEFTITRNGKEIQAQETLNTSENLALFYGKATGDSKVIKSGLTSEEFNSAFENWSSAEASETASILKELGSELEAMLANSKTEAEDPSMYDLNYTWEEFQELYGDGKLNGTYIDMVIETSINKSENYAQLEKIGHNQVSPELPESNYSQAETAVGKGLDELNEKVKIRLKNENKQ